MSRSKKPHLLSGQKSNAARAELAEATGTVKHHATRGELAELEEIRYAASSELPTSHSEPKSDAARRESETRVRQEGEA
jgi:hypothetical protein